ncbi:hypothetical protein KJ758_02525, partial [Patescibacteria group bacterium]|nr:hypothetical protein [Patescibacteria group bacterium]
ERRSHTAPTLPGGAVARRWPGRGGGSRREPRPNPSLSAMKNGQSSDWPFFIKKKGSQPTAWLT